MPKKNPPVVSSKGKQKSRLRTGTLTEYNPKYCEELIAFFEVEPYEDVSVNHFGKDGELKWVDTRRVACKLPTFVGFAKKIGVTRSMLYYWGRTHDDFDAAMEEARALREDILAQNGLLGLYNPIFAKFYATNKTSLRNAPDDDGKRGVTNVWNLNVQFDDPARVAKDYRQILRDVSKGKPVQIQKSAKV